MKEVSGNIWAWYAQGHAIAITINGYVNKNKEAVMKKGVAGQAAQKFPELPRLLAGYLLSESWDIPVEIRPRIFTLPVKQRFGIATKSNLVNDCNFVIGQRVPGWALKADKKLIERSLGELEKVNYYDHVIIPRPGCGAGELDWELEVKPICQAFGSWLWVTSI